MQKISSYLYPNRISVVVDLASYLTEWKIVYQRRLKLYQGVDNVIEFDIKNAQQRRIDVTGFNIKCIITDQNDTEVGIIDVVPVVGKTGIATMLVPASTINNLDPQFLNYALYIDVGDSTIRPVYADTQFGLAGTMEVLKGIVPSAGKTRIIDTFLFIMDDTNPSAVIKRYYSEAAEVKPLNDTGFLNKIDLTFDLTTLEGEVQVQISDRDVISSATPWTTIETFNVVSNTTTVSKTYTETVDYKSNPTWLRIKYTPVTGNTGKVDKVTVRI